MQKLKECQNNLINNPTSKEIQDGILDITYCCEIKKENDKTYLKIFVDKENSPIHNGCLKNGIKQMCSDCKNQSSVSV